jgi:hypothetical protein
MSLIPVYKASNTVHANIIRNMLEEAGIGASLRTDDANGLLPSLAAAEGVDVLVDETQSEEAESLLEQFKQGATALEEDGEG